MSPAKPQPTPRGLSVTAHRPSVFWPVPVPAVISVATMWATAIIVISVHDGDALSSVNVSIVSVATAVSSFILGIAVQGRDKAYQDLLSRQAGVSSSWKKLKAVTGINSAVRGNIDFLRNALADASPTRPGMRTKAAQLDSLAGKLHAIDPISRPTGKKDLKTWLKRRYRSVLEINRQLVDLCPELADGLRCDAEKNGMDIVAAYHEWESSIHVLRLTAAHQGALLEMVERVESLVKYWIVLALNDPRYCGTDKRLTAERKKAFCDADAAIKELEAAIMEKSAGSPWWRIILIRATWGRSAVAALTRDSRRIF